MGLRPILRPLLALAMGVWWHYRTFGLHLSHPDHARIALRRAELRGGVRL